jgi:hypothetical protein
MDVERIQKINNLALDLMKQGLATDRDDAISQAEKIFGGKDAESYTEMRETLQEIKEEKAENKEIRQDNTPELSQDQIKKILDQNTKFLVKTIKEFNSKMESMQMEISSLRTKMNYKGLPTVKDIVKEPIKEINLDEETGPSSASGVQVNAPSGAAKVDAKDGHPRVGNFVDTDVSIEKFFYMGNK